MRLLESLLLRESEKGSPTSGEEERAPLADEIFSVMEFLTDLLIRKNAKYGNSAIDPVYVFSSPKLSPTDQLYVQIDHKLARIKRGDKSMEDEDVLVDLVGYLVLALIARRQEIGHGDLREQ